MSNSKDESSSPFLPSQKDAEGRPSPSEADKEKVLAALEERQQHLADVTTTHTQIFSGPLPPPEAFTKYNEVLPDAADRILGMAEKEQRDRHEAQMSQIRNERHKVNASLVVSLAMLGVAGLATWFGQAVIAILLGLAGTAGIILRRFLESGPGSRRDRPHD